HALHTGPRTAPLHTTYLANPCYHDIPFQRARVDTLADRLLQQRAPRREAPLERIGRAQARRDRSQIGPVAGGTTQGQALVEHPDGVLQVPLLEVQVAEVVVGNDRCLPSA